jgi:hypothetical protein
LIFMNSPARRCGAATSGGERFWRYAHRRHTGASPEGLVQGGSNRWPAARCSVRMGCPEAGNGPTGRAGAPVSASSLKTRPRNHYSENRSKWLILKTKRALQPEWCPCKARGFHRKQRRTTAIMQIQGFCDRRWTTQ